MLMFRRPKEYVVLEQVRRRRRWILPLVCALGAFFVGMSVNCGFGVSILLALGIALLVNALRLRR
ncbi:hypothetical protein ACFXPA_27565 [Amycolatopsis sp. NPDC059090]|uniref:hypothetical protein n=1 Tax=unclassified Amycolatopsis TaxID=2618356 RepID=UPI00366F7671